MLVFVPDLVPNTFVYFSRNGNKTCLRDYSTGRFVPPITCRIHHVDTVRSAIEDEFSVARRHVGDWEYWHNHTIQANNDHDLPGSEPTLNYERGMLRMSAAIGRHFKETNLDQSGLNCAVDGLLSGLSTIRPKRDFNRYDLHVPKPNLPFRSGMHWTSWMLMQSRCSPFRVSTGSDTHDYQLLAQELNLRIAKSENPSRPGHGESIEPDGLAVRTVDNSIAVLEVKAKKDVQYLVPATLQAFCGALAICAKIDMIREIASRSNGERLEVDLKVSRGQPYISLYIMVHTLELPEGLSCLVKGLKASFAPLREVAYFELDQSDQTSPKVIFRECVE